MPCLFPLVGHRIKKFAELSSMLADMSKAKMLRNGMQEDLMSFYMKLSTKVSARDLFDEMKKFGIWEAPLRNDERARCLTDGCSYLLVYLTEDGFVSLLAIYGVIVPEKIFDAIWQTFGEIYDEHDPRYWGCDTQGEWEAKMPDIAAQFRWVEPSEEQLARDKKLKAWFIAHAIPIAGGGWRIPPKGSGE